MQDLPVRQLTTTFLFAYPHIMLAEQEHKEGILH